MRTIGIGAAVALLLVGLPHVGLAQTAKSTTYTNPFAYCAAIGTVDAPKPPYRGPNSPKEIERALFEPGSFEGIGGFAWRCENRQVKACLLGANGRACMKKDLSRVPNAQLVRTCRNDRYPVLSSAITAYSAYEWECSGSRPRIVSGPSVDSTGFMPDAWDIIGGGTSVRAASEAVSSTAAKPKGGDASLYLTPEGFGKFKIGMTFDRAMSIDGGRATLMSDINAACIVVSLTDAALDLMFVDRRLSRISLQKGSVIKTPRGIGVGSTESQVRSAYGSSLEVENNVYDPVPAKYLTFWLKKDISGVRFETNSARRVTQIHAGNGTINYIEGCS